MSEMIELENANPYDGAVDNLSQGLLKIYEPSLKDTQRQLKELTGKQDSLIIQIHQENLSLADVQHSPEMQDMFRKMTLYHGKLSNIKKDMKQLHDRTVKLKKRASKLQQAKEKENLEKLQHEMKIKREEELIGQGPCASRTAAKSLNEYTT